MEVLFGISSVAGRVTKSHMGTVYRQKLMWTGWDRLGIGIKNKVFNTVKYLRDT
jgi:hypothetical protein